MDRRRPRAFWGCRAGAVLLALLWILAAGCEQGKAPYEVIPSSGPPEIFLPPAGITPGTTVELGLLYRFDRSGPYRLFAALPGTDPRFVRRDSVLALKIADNPGAPQSLRLRPDLSDPELARVYANPRLFGFVASDTNGFFESPNRTTEAYRYFPTQDNDWWQFNHNELTWSITDSIVSHSGATPPTAGGRDVFHLRETCVVTPDKQNEFLPIAYTADTYGSALPGDGILFHAWTLISERDVPRELWTGELTAPRLQRNPRFLWLSSQSLDLTRDPQASPPVTIDQCLDNLPAHLDLFPLKVCDDEIQEGKIYTTWTYLAVDDDVLRRRLASEAHVERGGRCGQDVVVGRDTLRMFPTRTFRLLCKFEVRTERVVSQVTLTRQQDITGQYPKTPAPGAVVLFRITMSIFAGVQSTPVQYLEQWYLRDIGPVIRRQGVNPASRSSARLARCEVSPFGLLEQPNSVFIYNP
jgi:hypothetical protein